MYDVFISYAHEDRSHAKRLAKAFESRQGWSTWWDVQLRTGERFPRKIQQILASTRCVVVLWSPHSVSSDWVIAEASEGWQRGVLIPVCIKVCEPPMPFRQTQSTALTDWNGSVSTPPFLKLLEDVQRIVSRSHVADRNELQEREARRRRYWRRLITRRLALTTSIVIAVFMLWFLSRTYFMRQETERFAERLAAHADEIRSEVLIRKPDEENKTWWALLNKRWRIDHLELSILLATEAMKRAPTERTEHSLREGLLLLPWADKRLEIDVQNSVRALDFNYDGSLLAAASGTDGTLIWNLVSDKVTVRIPHGGNGGKGGKRSHRGPFVVDFSPNRNVVATAGPDYTARLWDANTGSELHSLEHDSKVTAVCFGPRGDILASSTKGGAVLVWDAQSGSQLLRMQHNDAVNWVGVSPLGSYVASTSLDKTARVWETSTGNQLVRLKHEDVPESARFSPDEAWIATFGDNVKTTLWQLPSGIQTWRLPVQSNCNTGVVFGPEGRTLVVGGTDGYLYWWDVEQRQELFSNSHESYVLGMAVNPDRTVLATIGSDSTARAWDMFTGRELKRIPYTRFSIGIAISHDGQFFAAAGEEPLGTGAIEVIRVWPDDPVEFACSQLSRNMTKNEWRQYIGDEPYSLTCPNIRADKKNVDH